MRGLRYIVDAGFSQLDLFVTVLVVIVAGMFLSKMARRLK